MPRGKKSEGAAPPPSGVSKRVFMGFLSEVKDLRQDLDDANMKHAAEWKEAEKRGIHPQAAKMIARLDKMEEAKRTDFLLSFFKYLPWMGWGKQIEMFEQPIAALSEHDDGEGGPGGGEDEREPAISELLPAETSEQRDAPPSAEQALKEQAEEPEEIDDTPAQATEELANGGFTFQAGKEAGERGDHVDSCQHLEGSPSFKLWMNGYARGVMNREGSSKSEPEQSPPSPDAETETAAPRRRARRGAPAESSTSVH